MLLVHSSSSLESIGQLICLILLFLFVVFLAYVAARISGSLQANTLNRNSNIKIIEVYRLSNSKLIEIVQIGKHYYALAVGKDSVNLIAKLEDDEITTQPPALEPVSFKKILEKMKNERKEKDS